MSQWIENVFGTKKPIIAMCHLKALPGDPGYDKNKGLGHVIESARKDLIALQHGGVDAVMFSNEASLPYLTTVEPITTICMARIIGELLDQITIPFGVNVLWDPSASIDLAKATGAKFVREIFTGVYASDFGLWNTNCGEVVRHQYAIGAEDVKLLFNIMPEAAVYLGGRDIVSVARSTVFNAQPDALCISGLTAGEDADTAALQKVKEAVPDTPVFANTGVNLNTVEEKLTVADGCIIGTTFKKEGVIWNQVDQSRVEKLMEKVHQVRGD